MQIRPHPGLSAEMVEEFMSASSRHFFQLCEEEEAREARDWPEGRSIEPKQIETRVERLPEPKANDEQIPF
jgi:hypothetical protein